MYTVRYDKHAFHRSCLPGLQVEAFFEYYPRRVGQVLFVDAPWVFYPAWEVIKPLMRKYKALVSAAT